MNSRHREGGKMAKVNILIEALENIGSWEIKEEERIARAMAQCAIRALVDYRDWEWVEESEVKYGRIRAGI